nr:DEAD/DEAH box helicase [Scytonema sp. UIC 10036]
MHEKDDKGEQHPPFGDWQLYSHQQAAIEQILAGKNTIVSSGTGSGKTESFFIPILNHCLQNPGAGIKALILYYFYSASPN